MASLENSAHTREYRNKNMPLLQNAFICLHMYCIHHCICLISLEITSRIVWLQFSFNNMYTKLMQISILLSSVLHPVSDSNYIIFLRLIITVEEQFEHNMPFWNKLANRVRGDVMFLSITSMEHRIRKIAALCTFLLHPYYNTSTLFTTCKNWKYFH